MGRPSRHTQHDPVDLHVHTTASDGTVTPSRVIELASEAGLAAIAITDHDTVGGVHEAREAAADSGVLVIPGVELSTNAGGVDIHVLGLYIDADDAALLEQLEILRTSRIERAQRIVEELGDGGYPLGMDEILELAQHGSVGRGHVARALVARGHASSMRDAFDRFIGRAAPFFVAKPLSLPDEAVRLIRAAGGLPVIAHPGVSGADAFIPGLAAAGLAGIEAYHIEHGARARARYRDMAASMGLLTTGGTDFHGSSRGAKLGECDVPAGTLDALQRAAMRQP